jgi:manganese transport protein
MGKFKISNKVKVAAWVIAATIVSLNLTLVREELLSFLDYLGEGNLFFKLLVFCMLLYALFLMAYITFEPLINTQKSEKQSLPHSSEVHIGEFKTPTYRHIAVTLDFTTNDEVTINTALAMGGTQAQYLFIHIVESAGAISMGDDIIDSETKKDFEILKRYQAQVSKRGFHVDIELGYGKSAKAIINIVNQKECDLVVMAAHGHQGFKDFIFGSTVDSVRHGVKAPVFIVK